MFDLAFRGLRRLLRVLGEQLAARSRALAPPGAVESLSSAERLALERNRALRGRHEGSRCFVIGDGRSAIELDRDALAGEITILAPQGAAARPLAGRRYSYAWLSPDQPPLAAEWLEIRRLGEAVSAETTSYRVVLDPRLEAAAAPALDFASPQPGLWQTLELSIALALYLGCDPVYLLGFEHDWLAAPGAAPQLPEQLGRDYWDRIVYAQQRWAAYKRIGELASADGRRIRNVSPGSFLDLFEHASLPDALAARLG